MLTRRDLPVLTRRDLPVLTRRDLPVLTRRDPACGDPLCVAGPVLLIGRRPRSGAQAMPGWRLGVGLRRLGGG
jgi:hypothetical protein